jgi:hypothetical protein
MYAVNVAAQQPVLSLAMFIIIIRAGRRRTGFHFFSFFISKLTKNQLLAVKDRLNKSFVVHQV